MYHRDEGFYLIDNMKKGGTNYVLVPKVICSSLLQLTPGSHGLFEAEKKITDVAS